MHRRLVAGPGQRSGRARTGRAGTGRATTTRTHAGLCLCPRLYAAHPGARRSDGRNLGATGPCRRAEAGTATLDLGGPHLSWLVRDRVGPPRGRNRGAGEAALLPADGTTRL